MGPVAELTDEFNGSKLDTHGCPNTLIGKAGSPAASTPRISRCAEDLCGSNPAARISDLGEVKDPMKDVWVSAACVTSKAPICSYGYYEARTKASRLSMTSSFWMQGKYSELDVVEQLGAPLKEPSRNRYMLTTTRYFRDGWNMVRDTKMRWRMPSGAADKYHVYGVWWKDKDNV